MQNLLSGKVVSLNTVLLSGEAGNVLERLHSNWQSKTPFFPLIFIMGDSLAHDIRVDVSLTVALLGGKTEFIMHSASFLVPSSADFLFLIAGTNDLVKKDNSMISPKLV